MDISKFSWTAGAAALALTGTARAQCYASRLFPDKPVAGDVLGSAVDISDTRAILGAPRTGNDGRVVIFERTGPRQWSQIQAIESPETVDPLEYFGAAVAIEGNFAAVGAPYADIPGAANGGRVYIYRRVTVLGNPSWILDERIDNPFAGVNERFGTSVALTMIGSTLTLAAGAPLADVSGVTDVGRVRIFIRNSSTGVWSLQDSVLSTSPQEEGDFGRSVALDGDRLVVGARGETVGSAIHTGAAYVFTKSGSDWGSGTRISAPAEFRANTDEFGADVAISGSAIAVGAPRVDIDGVNDAGAIFTYSSLGPGWVFNERVLDPDPPSANLGGQIALANGLLAAGALFENEAMFWRYGSGDWNAQFPFALPADAPPGTHTFGSDVALSDDGEYLLVGDRLDSGSGAAYVFTTDLNPGLTCAGGLFDPVPLVEPGTSYFGCNSGAATDGSACITTNADVWYRYTATCDGILGLSTCGTHDLGDQDAGLDTVLSVHSGCPGTTDNILVCNNNAPTGNWADACGASGNVGTARDAAVKVGVRAGLSYRIRVASNGSAGPTGLFILNVEFTCCLVDWDANGIVNSTDVGAFINDWFADQVNGTLVSDFDANGIVNSTDVGEFINEWFVGCEF